MQDKLLVVMIQSALFWEDPQKNIQAFSQKIEQIEQPIDLIILPEMFTTGFSMKPKILYETMDGITIRWMKKVAKEKNCAITGSLIIKELDHFYNRLIWVDDSGVLQYYDKKHLFTLANEHLHYSVGTESLIVSLKGWKIRPVICYDLRFPVWLRNKWFGDDRYEYDVLLVIANWPQKRNAAWSTLLQARAIENQSYVIGLNRVGEDENGILYSGDSAVLDALGETIYRKSDVEDIAIVSLRIDLLQKTREALPFLRDADEFTIL